MVNIANTNVGTRQNQDSLSTDFDFNNTLNTEIKKIGSDEDGVITGKIKTQLSDGREVVIEARIPPLHDGSPSTFKVISINGSDIEDPKSLSGRYPGWTLVRSQFMDAVGKKFKTKWTAKSGSPSYQDVRSWHKGFRPKRSQES